MRAGRIPKKIVARGERRIKKIWSRFVNWSNDVTWNMVWLAYSSENAWVLTHGLRLANFFHCLSKFVLKGLKVQVMRFSGEEACTNQPLRLLYIGPDTDLCIIQHRFYGTHPFDQENLETCWFYQARSRLKRYRDKADLFMVSRNSLLKWVPKDGSWVAIASQLRMVMDFGPDQPWSAIEKVMKRRQSYNLHKIRDNGYHLETSREPRDLDFFISQMYFPYVQHRYKERGQVASRWYLKKLFPEVELKFSVCPDGERVAGLYCFERGRIAHWMYLAALNGNEYWTEQGALAAVYYYGLQEAFTHGYRRVDVGEVRPFKDEPLFTHKRHWGLNPFPIHGITWIG